MGVVDALGLKLNAHPDRMTARARVYLFTTAAMHGPLAALCLALPDTFQSPSYEVVILGAPLWVSGLVFALAAVVCMAAAATYSTRLARVGLGAAFVVSGTWAIGLLAAIVLGNPAGYTAPAVWCALAIKDGLQCLNPQRLPLEPVVRSVLADTAANTTRDAAHQRAVDLRRALPGTG